MMDITFAYLIDIFLHLDKYLGMIINNMDLKHI